MKAIRAAATALLALSGILSAKGAHAEEPAADPCRPLDGAGRVMVACFDPGTRLRLDASTAGVGTGIDVRHRVATDDPRIHYRLEHTALDGNLGSTRYAIAAYAMRFVRHAESGYLTIPTRPPRQLRLPFDLGVEASALALSGERHDRVARLSVVRVAPLADLARSTDGRYRLAIGPVVRWDATVDRVARRTLVHEVAPFTLGTLSAYAESEDGLTLGRLSAEAGASRTGEEGLARVLRAEASIERVVVSLNDQPLSLWLSGRYEDPGRGLTALAGIRFAILTGSRR